MSQSSSSDFSLSITRIAVAQICQYVGYDAAQASALNTLSNVAACYLTAVAKSAAESANSYGRTQSNLFDIVIALEHLGSGQGFPGASSTIRNSIISSSLLKEIKKFVLYTDEIPFAQPIPRENLPLLRRDGGHRNEEGSYSFGVSLRHVPKWLPEMPAVEEKEEELKKRDEISRRYFGDQDMVVVVVEGDRREKEGKRRNGKGYNLPEKRGKVSFEMGLKAKSPGVLSRVGIGKRVSCHNLISGGNGFEEGIELKKKMVNRPPR